jgi:hypothetical protein
MIISPYFPPDNTADMHRVRQSLNYYEKMGWKPIVLCVEPSDTEAYKDYTLLETIDQTIEIFRVSVASPRITRKIGLGSIALRSLLPIYRKGSEIIKNIKPELIFFSTTQFPIMVLGRLWKMQFKIPYVLDFQDPWHTDHYLKLPKHLRPPKYWFSYRLNKTLEPGAIKNASGIISVTQAYINTFHNRYPSSRNIPYRVIPFGASEQDIQLKFEKYLPLFYNSGILKDKKKIVYTGVVNKEMIPVIEIILKAFSTILIRNPEKLQDYSIAFIGTNYGSGKNKHSKLHALIEKYSLSSFVYEYQERLGYLATLQVQKKASILLLCGTIDKDYIASKLAPYMLSGNPILAVYHKESALSENLKSESRIESIFFNNEDELGDLEKSIIERIECMTGNEAEYCSRPIENPEKYSSERLTYQQTELFNEVIVAMKK